MLKGIHHVAYVVADLDRTIEMFERVFAMKPDRREVHETWGQEVALYALESGGTLEVITPLHENTPWAEFLRRHGDGIHHIGYAVDDVNATLEQLESKGVRLKDRRAQLSGVGWTVASIDPESTNGLWVQLVERDRRE